MWAKASCKDATERLTRELEQLYADLRRQRRGDDGDPFYGRTWRPL
jgi:hypothetical protein